MPTAPISLYIDLEPGETAELESVARASLAFAAGIRELAYLFDPSFEFRIELERGDKGSLWLKAFVRWIRGLGHANPTLKAVVLSAATWFTLETGSYTYEKVLDHFLASKDPELIALSPDQLETLAKRVVAISHASSADQHFRDVYRALHNDRAVRAVGVAPTHEAPPKHLVPSSEFASRMHAAPPSAATGEVRIVKTTGDFVIIRPVLKEVKGRWRLRGRHGEFSAEIADDAFYNDVLAGRANVPLAAEIHMGADLETRETLTEEGVWKPTSHRITKVHSMTRQARQQGLFSPPEAQDQKPGGSDDAGDGPGGPPA